MKNYILKVNIKREVAKLNKSIDSKIIKGISYKKDARRHKFLTGELRLLQEIEKGNSIGIFHRLSHVFASFIL